MLDKIKSYGGRLAKGLLLQITPGVAAGAINELFHQWNVDLPKVVSDIQNNNALLEKITDEQLKQLRTVASLTGNLDFLTVDFIADAIKADFPAVASLFISWNAARAWLERQITDLKKRAYE